MHRLLIGIFLTGYLCLFYNMGKTTSKENIRLLVENELFAISKQKLNSSSDSSFLFFWYDFREAVISMDSLKLLSMAQFPVVIHGYLDEDPRYEITINEFIKVFKIYLGLDTTYLSDDYLKKEYNENLKYIKETSDLSSCRTCSHTNVWYRMGNLEFEKFNGHWKLLSIYIDSYIIRRLLEE